MAGVTAAITALGGMGLSAAQMVNAKQKGRQAREAAKTAMNQMMNTQEENKMTSLQSPDVSSLQNQANTAQAKQAVTAMQEMGPEGAAGVTGIVEAGRQANLQTAQAQAEANYNRDLAVLSNEQAVNKSNTENKREALLMETMGAQAAAANAQDQFNQGLAGLGSSAGLLIGQTGGLTGYTSGKYSKKTLPLSESDLTSEQFAMWKDAKNKGANWDEFLKSI